MFPPTKVRPKGTIVLLSVSPFNDELLPLRQIVGHSTWVLYEARDLVSAVTLLQQHEISVVLCERDLQPGTWRDMLEHTKSLPNAPSVIVASRLADEHLWAEALNLGAWDVLAKPFDRTEVLRSVKSGWQHWYDRATAVRMAAAS